MGVFCIGGKEWNMGVGGTLWIGDAVCWSIAGAALNSPIKLTLLDVCWGAGTNGGIDWAKMYHLVTTVIIMWSII